MYLPHEQGMFRDRIVIAADQCVPVPDGIDPELRPALSLWQSAFTQPIAVKRLQAALLARSSW